VYDRRNEPHEFVAETHEEAIEKACKFFGVGVDSLEVLGFEAGQVYGLAGRVVVVAGLRDRRPAAPSQRQRGRPGEERGEPRGEGRGRGRGEGRGRRREEEGREPRGAGGAPRVERPERPARAEAPSEPSVGTAEGSLGEIGAFVHGLVERMGRGPFTISEAREAEMIVVHLRGPAAEALTADDPRIGEAIQLLANQATLRLVAEDQEPPRVVVDLEGGAESRESFLAAMAERVARRAVETGRAVALDPMNPRDRRAIHLALRGTQGVATMSRGEGRYRQVVVVPEGAPEYDEAVAQTDLATGAS
jgi:spoIIIJ-associated protein